ncbi:SUMF1/EgtB/PvdO family nonheme iron enzyme [Leptothrix ochracea]|uniref:SUMF1/EgtB/PvdO family nonheme iron enzyme n=1 Tax=Leptothrix ochracea TaxID=735331 RepID=UPI0034E2E51F
MGSDDLHDMIGNVREWVADCYKKSHEAPPTAMAPCSACALPRCCPKSSWRVCSPSQR